MRYTSEELETLYREVFGENNEEEVAHFDTVTPFDTRPFKKFSMYEDIPVKYSNKSE